MIDYTIKKFVPVIKSVKTLSDEETMNLINQYTTRPFTKDEICIVDLVLCDNEIDRDLEMFTVDSLQSIAKLAVGKTILQDHYWALKTQSARIFYSWVEKASDNKANSLGEDYYQCKAKIYIPRLDSTKDFIEKVESGLYKEVSIGFGSGIKCSICGKSLFICDHYKNQEYDGKKCYGILTPIKDFYEASFVAVPAQPAAGVSKDFKPEADDNKDQEDQIIQEAKNKKKRALLLSLSLYD